ncbi:hypothetical protein [Halomontanus rarus]|uniref:hypothetical protein n=1 Tax=Halomontanus rarus TaxID=3034020 RepID=UPI0023E8DA37|nr:hypothetical protein [Halovivax sp. TS33]
MSDTDLAKIVTEEVTDQLDTSDLLGGGSIEDQLDAGEIGAAVGREFGASFGRRLGEEVGGNVHDALASSLENDVDREEFGEEVKRAIRDGVRTAFGGMDGRESLVTMLQSIGDEDGIGDQLSEVIPAEGDEGEAESESDRGITERVDDATPDMLESDEGEDEAGEESEDEADESESEGDGEAEGEEKEEEEETALEAADLEGVRRDTLEDLLEVMSYRDLQSVAKDVGVKANLSREEMTEEIVETVAGDESESESESDANSNSNGEPEAEAE